MKRILLVALLAAISTGTALSQELKLPALSPTARISQDFSTSNIEITYSRPSMRGRKVFGDIVAYNEPWRTGANAPTKIKIGEELQIGGQTVKPGEYVLYAIPAQSKWEIVINKGASNWSADGFDKNDDVARFKVKPISTGETVQTFTINISDITLNSCDLELMWEKTKVVIPIVANNNERLTASIDKSLSKPVLPYHQAASYYFETNQHLDKAYEYATKATEQNPQAFWSYHLKARIAQKLGRKKDAIEAANKSIELAKGSALEAEYQRNNQKIIKSFR